MRVEPDLQIMESIASGLRTIESALLAAVRAGAHQGKDLHDVMSDLSNLIPGIRAEYDRLQQFLSTRDLTYEMVGKLEELKRVSLWLYRKVRLELLFFSKLRVERALRDKLHRQILETYDTLTKFDEAEKVVNGLNEEELGFELLEGRAFGDEAKEDCDEANS